MGSSFLTLIRNLHDRKGRRREARALAEGVRLVEEAMASGVPLHGVAVIEDASPDARRDAIVQALTTRGVAVERVPATVFAGLAATDSPQGIIAVVEPPVWSLTDLDADAGPVLVLDAVQDPGNVGTLLRTAWALGAAGAVLLKGTADPYNAKVVRAAMGATFRLPVVITETSVLLAWAASLALPVWAATLDGVPVTERPLPQRLALAVGNEGAGLGEEILGVASGRVSVGITPGVDSLNVATAAGILLHEVRRGR